MNKNDCISEYILLRVQTEEQPATDEYPPQIKTKFFPILSQRGRKRITIPALTGELALEKAKQRFPMLRFSLCVQEVISYDQSITRILATLAANRSKGIHRPNAPERYKPQSPHSSGGNNPP